MDYVSAVTKYPACNHSLRDRGPLGLGSHVEDTVGEVGMATVLHSQLGHRVTKTHSDIAHTRELCDTDLMTSLIKPLQQATMSALKTSEEVKNGLSKLQKAGGRRRRSKGGGSGYLN